VKPSIVLVTSDASALGEIVKKAAERKRILCNIVSSPQEARQHWGNEGTKLLGVVGDSLSLNAQQKFELLQYHCEPGAPKLILLDPPGTPDPRTPLETVTRLRWPMSSDFLEALQTLANEPLIFLADSTLSLTGMLQARLKSIGILPMALESTVGLPEILAQAQSQGTAPSDDAGSLWSKLTGKKAEGETEEAVPQGVYGKSAIVEWKGDAFDAQPVQQHLAQRIPNVRVFLVSSASAGHNAERALKKGRPAFLPRDLAEHAIPLLLGKEEVSGKGLGRILLVDNFKPMLIEQTAALMGEGYEVSACLQAEEGLRIVQEDRMHIAVIGAAQGDAQRAGVELSQRMRELDPDIRIVMMMDSLGLSANALMQRVSQVIEVGLDDCLVKPVEPSRLLLSISRSLERRRLLIENRQQREELAEMNEENEALIGFQQKFFSMVAHDVKNPLTAIRGYAELLSWKVKQPDLMKCVQHIQSSSKTLEGLISDLVDLAAIENGKLRVNLEECDLLQVANEVYSRVKVQAEKREITVHLELPEALPFVQGDPLRLGQVIQNLSTNAIQYTSEKGQVFIKIQPGPEVITVSVRDTGIGISKEDLPRVFERFFQAENAVKMRRAGFGLGLKISQEIVKAHGGGMGVDSELGKGSVFYFTIPTPTGAPAQPAPAAPQAQQTPAQASAPAPAATDGQPRGEAFSPPTPPPQSARPPLNGPTTPPPATPPPSLQAPQTPVPKPPQ
jgi:signal transduction histidine kinase